MIFLNKVLVVCWACRNKYTSELNETLIYAFVIMSENTLTFLYRILLSNCEVTGISVTVSACSLHTWDRGSRHLSSEYHTNSCTCDERYIYWDIPMYLYSLSSLLLQQPFYLKLIHLCKLFKPNKLTILTQYESPFGQFKG